MLQVKERLVQVDGGRGGLGVAKLSGKKKTSVYQIAIFLKSFEMSSIFSFDTVPRTDIGGIAGERKQSHRGNAQG